MLGGVLGHYIQGAVTFKGALLFSVCGIFTVYSKARQFCTVKLIMKFMMLHKLPLVITM